MSREKLVRRLEGLKWKEPAQCFVMIWTYLTPALLNAAEEALDAQGIPPSRLRSYITKQSPAYSPPQKVISTLQDLQVNTVAFDRLLLEWLICLDKELQKRRCNHLQLQGFENGKLYRIRRSNNFIADYLEARLREVTWEGFQGASIAAFARFHVVVPCEHSSGFEIICREAEKWAGRELSRRLLQVKRRCDLRILLWPFKQGPVYSNLDVEKLPLYFRLAEIDNETIILAEIEEALEVARRQQTTILMLPELSITPSVDQVMRKILHANRASKYPLLILYGCCHRRTEVGDRDLNEAVLLNSHGQEVLPRHRKMMPYVHREIGLETKEQLARGTKLSVLESPLGNLVLLICLDFFHPRVSEAIADTHGNLLLVPSLSRKTTAHRISAMRFQVQNKASSFVCNRWLDHVWTDGQEVEEDPESRGTSFFHIPTRGGYVSHLGDRYGLPYLLFSLMEERYRLLESVVAG